MAYNPTLPAGQAVMASSSPVVIASNQSAIPITGSQTAVSSTSWTSATALNTANTIAITNLNTVTVVLVPTTTFTGGVVTFEVSPDGNNWVPIAMARVDSYTVETSYTIVASVNRAWSTSVDGFTNFRVRLSTVIAGTGTLGVLVTAQLFAIEPVVTVGQSLASNLQATVTPIASNLSVTAVSGANAAVTLTLPAVAGQFHYITRIVAERYATTAIAGTAVLTYTSTNLPGSWARSSANAATVGVQYKDIDEQLGSSPLKSSVANTATTIIAPAAGATGIIRLTAYYYTGV